MSERWPLKTLGDLVTLQRGMDLPDSQRTDGSVPVMGSFGITGRHSVAACKGPGVTVGRSGASIGTVAYIDEDYWPLNTCLYVRDFHGNNRKFCYYFLKTMELAAHNSGSAQPSLNRNYVHPLPVRIPSLSEQEDIAATLGTLDDKIEMNRKINETLEAMARALFRDWFVDFGPTRAKMEGRPAYLSEELWSLFPDRLDDAGKPEGWENSTIGEEVRVVGGSTPSTKESEFWDGGINWATPKDLSTLSSPVLLETSRTISEAGLTKISSGLLPEGTLLLSSRAPIGYLAIAEVPVAINQGFIAMICDKGISNVFAWMWTLENMEAILSKANGSTFQEISKGNFRPLPVVVPPGEILMTFGAVAEPLYERIATNERESRTLAGIRGLLLPRLMSGEVQLRDSDRLLEGAD